MKRTQWDRRERVGLKKDEEARKEGTNVRPKKIWHWKKEREKETRKTKSLDPWHAPFFTWIEKRLFGIEVGHFSHFIFLFFFPFSIPGHQLLTGKSPWRLHSIFSTKKKKNHSHCASLLTNSDLVLTGETFWTDNLLLSELYATCQDNTCLPSTLVQIPSGLVYTWKAMPMKNEDAESGWYWCFRCCLQNTKHRLFKLETTTSGSKFNRYLKCGLPKPSTWKKPFLLFFPRTGRSKLFSDFNSRGS